MGSKSYASAALDRAEAAARNVGRPVPRGRSAGTGKKGSLESSARSLLGAVTDDHLLWDPLAQSASERVARFLRTSSEVQCASEALRNRQQAEGYIDGLDRQLAQVEKSRALIACALASTQKAGKEEPCHQKSSSLRRPSETGRTGRSLTAAPSSQHDGVAAANSSPASLPRNASHPPTVSKTKQLFPWSICELKPTCCSRDLAGRDCPCCLMAITEGSKVLSFPCPGNHLFHAGCLTEWLRIGGRKFTCPVCRAWPRGRISSSQH